MPRMFTDTHRKKYFRRADDPQYHGHKCEGIYREAMDTLQKLHYYKQAIGAMRMRERMTVNTSRKFQEWERLGTLIKGNPSYEELRSEVNLCAFRLKRLRIEYTEEHSRRHNQPLSFEVRDADNNRVDVFVTHEAARYCKLHSGLGANIIRYEGDK